MEINRERLVRTFRDLVAIDSPSLGERNMADELTRRLKRLGFTVEEDRAGEQAGGNCGNLYAYLCGNEALPPLLFCAHMDTVQPARGKRTVLELDGRIRSAGESVLGADDVSAIAAILEAAQTLAENGAPHRGVELLLTISEERYGTGAAAFDYSRIRAKEAYVPDYDGAHGQAVVAAPSIIGFRAEITGKASHAGFAPELGVSAIAAAARAIAGLRLGRITPDLTMNIGTISGGLSTNIVPDSCAAAGEIRGYEHDEALEQLAKAEDAFQTACDEAGAKLRFSSKCFLCAYRIPEDAAVVARYFRVCGARGFPTEAVRTFGGSDNNALTEHGISGIVIASAMHACHTRSEYTSIEELSQLAQIVADLMRDRDCDVSSNG